MYDHDKDNKQQFYGNAISAVLNCHAYNDTRSKMIRDFIYYFEVLGCVAEEEDPTYYNDEWVRSLVCKYIPTNEEYISVFSGVDVEIITALNADNILNTTKLELYQRTKTGNSSYNTAAQNVIREAVNLVKSNYMDSSGSELSLEHYNELFRTDCTE